MWLEINFTAILIYYIYIYMYVNSWISYTFKLADQGFQTTGPGLMSLIYGTGVTDP